MPLVEILVRKKKRKYFWAGKVLEQLRKTLGITQEECARRSGYNVRAWRRIVSGDMRPPREKLIQHILIDTLGCQELDTIGQVLRFFDYDEVDLQETLRYAFDTPAHGSRHNPYGVSREIAIRLPLPVPRSAVE
jgi:transcriptional regulator with XRE-family HTH domain